MGVETMRVTVTLTPTLALPRQGGGNLKITPGLP